jgi:hypothetical protein
MEVTITDSLPMSDIRRWFSNDHNLCISVKLLFVVVVFVVVVVVCVCVCVCVCARARRGGVCRRETHIFEFSLFDGKEEMREWGFGNG